MAELALQLHSNHIGAAGAAAVAEALKRNNTLTTLGLDNNNIGEVGAAALAHALQGNTALTTLGLECVSALRSPSLRLNHSGVLSLGCRLFRSPLSFFALPYFLSPVVSLCASCISRMHLRPSRNSFWAR